MGLREIRRARKMTQDELRAASGISRATISALENCGDSHCSTTETLNKLAAALDCNASDILASSSKASAMQEDSSDSTSNSEPLFSVDVDEDEMRLLLLYRASKLNELGRKRLLGFTEGLLAAGMKKNPHRRA